MLTSRFNIHRTFDCLKCLLGKKDVIPVGPDTHHALQNFSENDVFAVQPWSLDGGDEELRAVGVFASVSHAEPASAVVLQLEVLIGETVSIDALAFSLEEKKLFVPFKYVLDNWLIFDFVLL